MPTNMGAAVAHSRAAVAHARLLWQALLLTRFGPTLPACLKLQPLKDKPETAPQCNWGAGR